MKKVISIMLCLALAVLALSACTAEKPAEKEPTAQKQYELKITSDYAYANYNSSVFSAYEALCKAVMSYESSVRLNTTLANDVRRLFYTSFPLNALTSDLGEAEDGSGIVITYTLGKEEHLAAVDAFKQKVKEVTDECADSNPNVYALKLYAYIAKNIKVSEDATISCYDTLMKGEGTSHSYAQLMTYLLRQGDVKASYITAVDAANTGWGLCQVNLKDEWFFLDPMTEFYDNQGAKLLYFGMTTKDIKREGLTKPVHSDSTSAADCSSLYFDSLRYCRLYELKDNTLLVTTTEGNIVQIDL